MTHEKEETLIPIKDSLPFQTNNVMTKLVIIGILILILLIPTQMISDLMKERKVRRSEVLREISSKWGGSQKITAPILTIPYKKYRKQIKYLGDNKPFETQTHSIEYLHILPKALDIKGKLLPKIRYRSIYKAVLYNAILEFRGSFQLQDFGIEKKDILWKKAFVAIGITDMLGIKENIPITFNTKIYKTYPGIASKDVITSGVSTKVSIDPEQANEIPFTFSLNINGSQVIQFAPIAEVTTVALSSSWNSPSFDGAFLPSKREITSKGFTANWRILHLNRNYPQYWSGISYSTAKSLFGLQFYITADVYQKSIRTVKYAIMFIAFTICAFFLSEILTKRRVHPIQYILIGLAITLFYILLISLSEHLSFNLAYLVSSISIILMVTGYTKGILGSTSFSLTICSILVILYSYLFIVLQLEDYSLLMGSLGLFLLLSTIMYLTRKIDWYNLEI